MIEVICMLLFPPLFDPSVFEKTNLGDQQEDYKVLPTTSYHNISYKKTVHIQTLYTHDLGQKKSALRGTSKVPSWSQLVH